MTGSTVGMLDGAEIPAKQLGSGNPLLPRAGLANWLKRDGLRAATRENNHLVAYLSASCLVLNLNGLSGPRSLVLCSSYVSYSSSPLVLVLSCSVVQ